MIVMATHVRTAVLDRRIVATVAEESMAKRLGGAAALEGPASWILRCV
jgi:hypothetical protein